MKYLLLAKPNPSLFILIITFVLIIKINNIAKAANSEKAHWEIGVCASFDKAETIKMSGFNYIEESVGGFLIPNEHEDKFNEKLDKFKQMGFKIYACNGFIPGNLKIVGPDTSHAAILKYVKTAIERANKAGIKIIVLGSGQSRNIPEGFSKDNAKKQFIKLALQIADIAKNNRVTICLETLNSAETNFINNLPEALEIVKAVNKSSFMLTVDIFHMLREKELPESIINAEKYIAHCHIAEVENRTPPGINGDNFIPYLQALKNIGYKGNISVECKWSDFNSEINIAYKELTKQINEVE